MSPECNTALDSTLRRLQKRRPLAIALALLFGMVLSWLLPSAWFLNMFLGAGAFTLLFGIASAAAAKDTKPLPSAAKAITFLAIGTSRPNADVPPGTVSMLFQVAASFTVGLGVGMVILNHV